MKVVCNSHRELIVCQFVCAYLLEWQEVLNLLKLADLRNDGHRVILEKKIHESTDSKTLVIFIFLQTT